MLEAEQERWLTLQANLGLAPNTLVAYRRAVEEYATFCARRQLEIRTATREHVALYVRDLAVRPVAPTLRSGSADRPPGLANATILQRLTAIQLYYDFLVEEGLRPDNPVGRPLSQGQCARQAQDSRLQRPLHAPAPGRLAHDPQQRPKRDFVRRP